MGLKSSGRDKTRRAGVHHTGRGHRHGFQRDLTTPSLTLLTVGGVMGSGLFMASGLAIRHAGPMVVFLYALGALAMYLEINALAEMSIATPTPGSFLVFTHKVLGAGWTFVAGWIFWFSSVLTMSSEVTAASLFTRYWFPTIPLWVWALAYSATIIAINFISVRGFGTIEGVMAGIKTVAVLAFIVVGALAVTGVLAHKPNPASPFTGHGVWIPHGWYGAAPAMLLVLFAYAGTGVIGLAAAEAKKPEKTLPQAIRLSVWLTTIMYLGSIVFILALTPWWRNSDKISPFVLALHAVPLPYGAWLMNGVLLFAVLSTMNAALYSNVRVLYSLAEQRQAPRALGRLNAKGLPTHAIWTSAALLGATIVLAYVLPHKAYAYLVTATGFQAMFIWLMILLTQLYYRPYLEKHHPEKLTHRLWGYPYTTYFVMAVVVLALLASPLAHGELVGALVGFGGILLTWLVWIALRKRIQSPSD